MTFPRPFAADPVFVLTPNEPDDSGVTRCRLVHRARTSVGWWCWTYATDAPAESVHWVAMDAGTFDVRTRGGASRKLMSGIFDSTAASCATCTILFPTGFTTGPLVFATVDESFDNSGPTSAKIVSVTGTTATTVTTSHNGGTSPAQTIHRLAIEPSSTDPFELGEQLLYAGTATVTTQTGSVSFPQALPQPPVSLLLMIQGGTATSVRHTTSGPSKYGFSYSMYTDTAGASGSTQINWLAVVNKL